MVKRMLTRNVGETIKERIKGDREFVNTLFDEAMELLSTGEWEVARSILLEIADEIKARG